MTFKFVNSIQVQISIIQIKWRKSMKRSDIIRK